MTTGIVVALPEELGTLTSKKIATGCCVFIRDAIVIAYSGAGANNARIASELLIAQGADRLISWGCAAALGGALNPGDLVLADSLIDADGVRIDIAPDWHGHTLNLLTTTLRTHVGCLAESKSIVASAQHKKSLHILTGAVALDMESIAVAKVARQNRLPFLAIRAIADPHNMNLPNAIEHSFNNQGDIDASKLLLYVALHPTELPGLIKLGLHFYAAKNALKRAAEQLDHVIAFASPDR